MWSLSLLILARKKIMESPLTRSTHISLSPTFQSSHPISRSMSIERSAREERAVDNVDVVIVGAGPAGLSSAIRLKQLAIEKGWNDMRVCVLEKGAEVGAHILSGAVIDPISLNELIPDWKEKGAPLRTEAKEDELYFLTEKSAFKLPVIPQLHNKGNYIISLGNLVRWLGQQAEELGVEIYPGIAGSEVLYDQQGRVQGIATNDVGIGRNGKRKDTFAPGMELHAKVTLFAEGCRGSLSKQVIRKFNLDREASSPPSYGIGLKELWKVDRAKHHPGLIQHSLGWPLDQSVYAGSFLYHLDGENGEPLVSVGYVIGLDYQNPYISPYKEFQRWKQHPSVRDVFEGGECLSYGARTISEGGLQSLPRLTFPGGALIGDSAGFLNVPRIKGSHAAIKSGMLCADAVMESLSSPMTSGETETLIEPQTYSSRFRSSWLYQELKHVRNFRPAFQYGLIPGLFIGALEMFVTRGRLPFTLNFRHGDHERIKDKSHYKPIDYPKPDGKISFDLLTNLSRSNTNHEEDQPCHLTLKDATVPTTINLPRYDGPESRYCPAGVYEYVDDPANIGHKKLQINQTNCIHCKTCDIKDPTQNINWVTPEGGGGPIYSSM